MAEIVLVHGAWHGPWCWDQVGAALEERGHAVDAIALPGHGQPGTTGRLWKRISHYVDAVADAVESASAPPVLVGHSMGGYVVQRYLEAGRAACAVLVASSPHRGLLRANLRALRRRPKPVLLAALTADYRSFIRTDELVRSQFFTDRTPPEIVADCRRQLQNESAIALNEMALRPPRPQRVSTPVAVIGARHDQIFTVEEQQALAKAYGVEAEIIDGGHDVMLDTTWPALVAALDRIASQYGDR